MPSWRLNVDVRAFGPLVPDAPDRVLLLMEMCPSGLEVQMINIEKSADEKSSHKVTFCQMFESMNCLFLQG